MRRILVPLILVVIGVALVFVLRERRRQFIAAQVQLLQSGELWQATAARRRLQRVGRSAVRPVCALLQHEDEQVRARAALCLANIGHPAACGPLMEAAKRGDFPAADALAFMKHPQAAEARAWVWCRLGDEALQERRLRLPVGGRMPTSPHVEWREPPEGFRPRTHESARPDELWVWARENWWWMWLQSSVSQSRCEGTEPEPDWCYRRSLQYHRLPGALIGRARVRLLCGDYRGAAEFYTGASELAAGSETVRTQAQEAERLARLARRMEASLPHGLRVQRVLTHHTWRQGSRTCYVGVASSGQPPATIASFAPTMILVRCQGARLDVAGTTDIFPEREVRCARGAGYWLPPAAYVDLAVPRRGAAAQVVVIRGPHRARPVYDIALYELGPRGLMKSLQLDSAVLPWAGDLDQDGKAEVVTFAWTASPAVFGISLPWPTVRTFLNGRYRVGSAHFPSVLRPIRRVIARGEEEQPLDPKLPHCLGRLDEVLGNGHAAGVAYRRAEGKYLATAARMEKRGLVGQARLHRKAAAAVRQRLRQLEAQGGTG